MRSKRPNSPNDSVFGGKSSSEAPCNVKPSSVEVISSALLSFRSKDDNAFDGTARFKDIVAAISERGAAAAEIRLNLCSSLLVHDSALGSWKHKRSHVSRLLADRKAEVCKEFGSGSLLSRTISFGGNQADHLHRILLSFFRL
jgi:hypothetical protein